jgi:hypothetical protein
MHRLLCLALVLGLAPVASGVEPAPLPQQFQRGEPLLNRAPNDELRGPRPVGEAEVPPPAAPAHDILAVADIGQPIRAGRVTVWPLQARLPAAGGDFLTLDEASASGKITVEEVGDGGTVNVLHVSNTSSETIYLMAGEVLLGGKQDRVVGPQHAGPRGLSGAGGARVLRRAWPLAAPDRAVRDQQEARALQAAPAGQRRVSRRRLETRSRPPTRGWTPTTPPTPTARP